MSPFCHNCGAIISETTRICHECGNATDEFQIASHNALKTPSYQFPPETKPEPRPAQEPPPQKHSPFQMVANKMQSLPKFKKKYKSSSEFPYGVIAIACAAIGLFTPILFAWFPTLLAIGLGSRGRKVENKTGLATLGVLLGVLSLACIFAFYFMPYPYFFFYR